MGMLAELFWPLRKRQLPQLRLSVSDDVRIHRAGKAFDWKKARAFHAETGASVGRVRFCLVPVMGRLYISGLWIEAPMRRQGYGTALIAALYDEAAEGQRGVAITPLRENLATHEFWRHMRTLAPRSMPVTGFFHPPGSGQQDTDWASSIASTLQP